MSRRWGALRARRSSLRPVRSSSDWARGPWVPRSARGLSLPLGYHPSWLRDQCSCARCIDPVSKQKLDPAGSFWPTPTVHSVLFDGTHLHVDWGGHHGASRYNTSELARRAAAYVVPEADGPQALAARRAAVALTAQPSVAWTTLASLESARAWLLRTLWGTGLCVVRGVPMRSGSVVAVAERVGPLMHTFYGAHWDVRAVADAQNVAYSNLVLDWHQDLLYFESPPGLQLLHCLSQADRGGATLFLDGVAAAESFQAAAPAHYAQLSRTKLPYHYTAMGVALSQLRPVFAPSSSVDSHRAVWWSPAWQAPTAQTSHDDAIYAALHAFHAHLSEQPALRLRLEPGDVVVFDNRRMLHAREAFEGGQRHLQGCYVAVDTFRAALHSEAVGAIAFEPSKQFQ